MAKPLAWLSLWSGLRPSRRLSHASGSTGNHNCRWILILIVARQELTYRQNYALPGRHSQPFVRIPMIPTRDSEMMPTTCSDMIATRRSEMIATTCSGVMPTRGDAA
jgi:hypothetical protein